MTLRAFLNAGYSLFVREFQRAGKHLFDAIDMTNEAFGFPKNEEAQEIQVEAQNEAALQQLTGMLGTVR